MEESRKNWAVLFLEKKLGIIVQSVSNPVFQGKEIQTEKRQI
jgi:hypothetical protein